MYQDYLTVIGGIRDEDKAFRYASYVSVLPVLSLAEKLLRRKNTGKKPFPAEFHYAERLTRLDNIRTSAEKTLMTVDADFDTLDRDFKEAESIIMAAKAEIRSASMRGDLDWVLTEIQSVTK